MLFILKQDTVSNSFICCAYSLVYLPVQAALASQSLYEVANSQICMTVKCQISADILALVINHFVRVCCLNPE